MPFRKMIHANASHSPPVAFDLDSLSTSLRSRQCLVHMTVPILGSKIAKEGLSTCWQDVREACGLACIRIATDMDIIVNALLWPYRKTSRGRSVAAYLIKEPWEHGYGWISFAPGLYT